MTQRFRSLFGYASLLLVMFSSCKKDKDNSPPVDSQFMVVNASPGSTPMETYLNDVKVSSSALSFGASTSYQPIAPKNYNIKVAAANTINPVAETNIGFGEGKIYSVFIYDTLASGKLKVFALEDDLRAPASGKAKVRFLHLSPGNISVDITANGTVVFPNRNFADNVSTPGQASFASVDGGTYAIGVRLAGSGAGIPAILTVPDVKLEAGKIYTIYAKGKVNGTGATALSAGVVVNK